MVNTSRLFVWMARVISGSVLLLVGASAVNVGPFRSTVLPGAALHLLAFLPLSVGLLISLDIGERSVKRLPPRAWATLAALLTLGIAIELYQLLYLPGRTPDAADVIASWLGTSAGFAIWLGLSHPGRADP